MSRKSIGTARAAAARALAQAAEQYPDIHPIAPDVERLSAADRRLALAIHRTAMQRWITLEYLLDRRLKAPMRMAKIEPALRGVLMAGAVQLLCFDRLPVHAVVDESVALAAAMVRRKAAGLVNAVLRRLSEDIARRRCDEPWFPAADRLPLDTGSIVLAGDLLPDAADMSRYLSVATSHPPALMDRWIDAFGDRTAAQLAAHGTLTGPIIVFDEHGAAALWRECTQPLGDWLAGHPLRRVQDVGSAQPLTVTASLSPKIILDYCAGRGTKTRQAVAMHKAAKVMAHDVDPDRLASLHDVVDRLERAAMWDRSSPCDLLVLDVPCSNSGALARRPEARYRFNARSLASVVDLQRRIIDDALAFVRPGGYVLYSTCSLERQENADQARYLARRCGGVIENQRLTLPAGPGNDYRDGSYAALVKVP